jgi:hypothetical protein
LKQEAKNPIIEMEKKLGGIHGQSNENSQEQPINQSTNWNEPPN